MTADSPAAAAAAASLRDCNIVRGDRLILTRLAHRAGMNLEVSAQTQDT